MVAIDIVLVMLEQHDFPTFSWVVRDNRTNLIWLTFLFGGLVAKIFYNRKVNLKDSEVSGFLAFLVMLILLFVLGQMMKESGIHLDSKYQFLLLASGGILAYRVWPQYVQLNEEE
jgi:hypothetical protein